MKRRTPSPKAAGSTTPPSSGGAIPQQAGDIIPRRFLTVMGGRELPPEDRSSGRRQLAEWIVDPANPLTARVLANRVWLYHFGKGLVATPNDFGRQGRQPSPSGTPRLAGDPPDAVGLVSQGSPPDDPPLPHATSSPAFRRTSPSRKIRRTSS